MIRGGVRNMMNGTNTSYPAAVAYQGGVNTPQQQPASNQTQPIQAAAADTQSSDDQQSSTYSSNNSQGRGSIVNVQA
jgi:hypothetical protein